MRPLTDLMGSTEFAIGLLVGTIALLVTLPAALGPAGARPRKGRRPGLFGPALGTGGVLAARRPARHRRAGVRPRRGRLGAPAPVDRRRGGRPRPRRRRSSGRWPPSRAPSSWPGPNQGLAAAWVPVVIVLGTVLVGMARGRSGPPDRPARARPAAHGDRGRRDLLHGPGHRDHAGGRRRHPPARAARLAVHGGGARGRRRLRRGRAPALGRADRGDRTARRHRRRARRVRVARDGAGGPGAGAVPRATAPAAPGLTSPGPAPCSSSPRSC